LRSPEPPRICFDPEPFPSPEVSMLPCTSGSVLEVSAENPMSLQRCGREEAHRYKWIQSEKEGRDLGDHAIRMWISAHWNGFLRHRWLEHLQGKNFWIELREEDFGLLRREFRDSTLLVPILERLKVLKENLDIIWWAVDLYTEEEMREIRAILAMLDVNACRLRADFDPWQSQVSSGKFVA
jgi:hypothetical protein